MTFAIPQQFGERACDRGMIALLRAGDSGMTEHAAVGLMLRVWRDFASGRDDRRVVPADPVARAGSLPVRIIEEFARWPGEPGAMVRAAIDAGFFTLVPVDGKSSQLVLADFFPANNVAANRISASRLGGVGKAVGIAERRASAAAKEQLDMFKASGDPVLAAHGEKDLKAALHFVMQLCAVLHRHPPRAEFWRKELAAKAIRVRGSTSQADLDRVFRWFVMNRQSPEIPLEIDFILDRFQDFVDRANHAFAPPAK